MNHETGKYFPESDYVLRLVNRTFPANRRTVISLLPEAGLHGIAP